ncbi:hypothetical protein FJSC11DRAFT_2390 [Fischerella thermalis JSC-11]|jgi:hypothetical protein|uniref:Uncharacterized protein n=1 Tax=Fischerella thermalis JSC-11 TaxID=741277 RepID=G6FU43_9CYAN|nr:hypothetical protein FJSC11DRAFT_2390 [Fischerella thermalis JSC-11]
MVLPPIRLKILLFPLSLGSFEADEECRHEVSTETVERQELPIAYFQQFNSLSKYLLFPVIVGKFSPFFVETQKLAQMIH